MKTRPLNLKNIPPTTKKPIKKIPSSPQKLNSAKIGPPFLKQDRFKFKSFEKKRFFQGC